MMGIFGNSIELIQKTFRYWRVLQIICIPSIFFIYFLKGKFFRRKRAKNVPQDIADPQYIEGNLLRAEGFFRDIVLFDRPANKNLVHAKCLLSHVLLPCIR